MRASRDMGPFRERTAAPLERAADVDISRPHTAFTLALTDTSHGFSGNVGYLPMRSGNYAVFTSAPAIVIITPQDGDESASRLIAHETELCPSCLGWKPYSSSRDHTR